MLACDDPRVFLETLPGFLPSGVGSGSAGKEHSPFGRTLREALLGPGCEIWADFSAPAAWRGDFWSSWYLAADARGSQYDVLRKAIADNDGLDGHLVCLALRGAGFHGQENRNWAVREGNLHLSLGLECDFPAAETGVALTMLPAVAVTDVLAEWGVPAAGDGRRGIKWVNDILVAGAKLGGVLTAVRSQDGRLRTAVLGIGLNVLAIPEVPPTPFTPAVTCLADHLPRADLSVAGVAAAVLRAVARRFEQLETEGRGALLVDYRRESLILGRRVTVQAGGPEDSFSRSGRVLEIRPDLALELSDDPTPVTGGRLILEPDHLP